MVGFRTSGPRRRQLVRPGVKPSTVVSRLGSQGLLHARVARLNVSRAMAGPQRGPYTHAHSAIGRRDAAGRHRVAALEVSAFEPLAPRTPIGNVFLLEDEPLLQLCVWLGVVAAASAWRPIDRSTVEPLRRVMGSELWARGLGSLEHEDSGLDVASERELCGHLLLSPDSEMVLRTLGFRCLFRTAVQFESRTYLKAVRQRAWIDRDMAIKLRVEPEFAKRFIERVALPTVLPDDAWVLAEV